MEIIMDIDLAWMIYGKTLKENVELALKFSSLKNDAVLDIGSNDGNFIIL